MGVLQDTYDRLVPEGSPGRGIDAAIARQFDRTPGGGIFDADTYNPFNNTQADRSASTDIPLTGVSITESGGLGVGYQPGQGLTGGPQGIRGTDVEQSVNEGVSFLEERYNQTTGGGPLAGQIPWAKIALIVGAFVFLRAFAGGLGEGLTS